MTRYGTVVFVFLLLVSTTGTAVEVPTAPGSDRAVLSGIDGGEPLVGLGVGQSTGNNSSVPRHRNPDKTAQEGSSEDVERWLAGRLSGRLNESVVQLSQGDYQRAKRLIGNDSEYSDMLQKYANVSDDTEGGESDTAFERTQRNQQQFVENVRSYRETLKRYREAKQNGDEQRARELARELNQYSERVKRNGSSLEGNLKNASSNETQVSNDVRTINEISENITAEQANVSQQEFVETRFEELLVSSNGSFRDPIRLNGALADENGSELRDRNITLRIGNRSVRTETDGEGEFNTSFRPTVLETGTHPRTIEYVPDNDSVYLGANGTANITVDRVEPTVEIGRAPNAGSYNDSLTVTGNVTAADVGAPQVPMVVTVGDVPIGTTRTSSNGSFTVVGSLPANVSAGDRSVSARVAQTGRAIANANASESMTVRSTPTDISMNATRNGEQIRATGALTTADGAGVANQTVQLRVDGRTVTTVETNATGNFSVTAPLPSNVTSETVTVAAVYADEGTNLESATAKTSIRLPSQTTGLSDWRVWLAGIGLLGLVASGAYVIWSRDPSESGSDWTDDAVVGDDPDGSDGSVERADEDVARELLETAREQLAADRPDAAVRTAYLAVRRRLAGESANDSNAGLTHWELYRAYRSDAAADDGDALYGLTRAYETSVFAATSLSDDEAEAAVDEAAALLSGESIGD